MKAIAGPLSGIATTTPGIVGMSKSKAFRNQAFPFLENPESLLLAGGPATAIPALGPKKYLDELQLALNQEDVPDFGEFF